MDPRRPLGEREALCVPLASDSVKCNTYPMAKPNIDINELSPEERLELIEELWDSLGGRSDTLALTDAQREELDRRIDEMNRDETLGEPWQDVLKSIREQK